MVRYDPNVIQEFANRLYSKADSIIRTYAILGFLLFGLIGLATQQPVVALLFAIIGGVLGHAVGKEKAFQYKLQAQTALCQVQIELNLSAKRKGVKERSFE